MFVYLIQHGRSCCIYINIIYIYIYTVLYIPRLESLSRGADFSAAHFLFASDQNVSAKILSPPCILQTFQSGYLPDTIFGTHHPKQIYKLRLVILAFFYGFLKLKFYL